MTVRAIADTFEINLLDRDAVQRLRLNILDPVDGGAHRVIAVGGDALLHLRRTETGVLPNDGDDRDVDFRENALMSSKGAPRIRSYHFYTSVAA